MLLLLRQKRSTKPILRSSNLQTRRWHTHLNEKQLLLSPSQEQTTSEMKKQSNILRQGIKNSVRMINNYLLASQRPLTLAITKTSTSLKMILRPLGLKPKNHWCLTTISISISSISLLQLKRQTNSSQLTRIILLQELTQESNSSISGWVFSDFYLCYFFCRGELTGKLQFTTSKATTHKLALANAQIPLA